MSPFVDDLYDGVDARDGAIFRPLGDRYKPPARFEHGEWHKIAEISKARPDGDGFAVEIYELRMPARFFKVEALASLDSMKRSRPGFTLSTGSGDDMGALCVRMALAIADGNLRSHALAFGASPKIEALRRSMVNAMLGARNSLNAETRAVHAEYEGLLRALLADADH